MQTKTIPIDQAKNPELPPSKHALELYAQLKADYQKGKGTEVSFGKNQWSRLKNDVIGLADKDGLFVYVNKADGYNMKSFWLEPKDARMAEESAI